MSSKEFDFGGPKIETKWQMCQVFKPVCPFRSSSASASSPLPTEREASSSLSRATPSAPPTSCPTRPSTSGWLRPPRLWPEVALSLNGAVKDCAFTDGLFHFVNGQRFKIERSFKDLML